VDVLLVDEASMVDAALMARLMERTPPHARVILLGDKDQLASVQAGAVLGSICGQSKNPDAATNPKLAGCIVTLEHSYRYAQERGIGELATAIVRGETARAIAILDSGDYPDIDWQRTDASRQLSPEYHERFVDAYRSYLAAEDAAEKLRRLDRFRVLCAHRRGPYGVEAINSSIVQKLSRNGSVQPHGDYFAGQPIMVTENDYQQGLFNGDVGLMLPTPVGKGELRACFFGQEGAIRDLSPAMLGPHETVFAMSIHKAQGSEFDQVAVVLPPMPSGVVSRELLYTAVTRARQQVTLYASEETLRYAIENPVQRSSGLAELLWAATDDD
jgi:exodeoxyribonuclease V alpha subunit